MSAHTPQERYAADLLSTNARLPLGISRDCHATIVDADGRDVATIDMNRERSDIEAAKIALWIILAVNTCGGHSAAAHEAIANFMLLYGDGNGRPAGVFFDAAGSATDV